MRQPVGRLRLCNLLRTAVSRELDRRDPGGKLRKRVRQPLVLLLAGGKLFVGQADVLCRCARYAVKARRCKAGLAQCRRRGGLRGCR